MTGLIRIDLLSNLMIQVTHGKLTSKDKKFARLLNWIPWLSFLLVSLPFPLLFFALFLSSVTPDSAAVYLLLAGVSLAFGSIVGLLILILLLFYRKRWFLDLRDRLAADGITATEVVWFKEELTTAEGDTLREITKRSEVLGDAYRETLAARLTASRIIAKTDRELVKVRARINSARLLSGAGTTILLSDLQSDQKRLEKLKNEANTQLTESKSRLQTIEATASRSLNQTEGDSMLRRLTTAQKHLPLVMEIEKLERGASQEAELRIEQCELTPEETATSKRQM